MAIIASYWLPFLGGVNSDAVSFLPRLVNAVCVISCSNQEFCDLVKLCLSYFCSWESGGVHFGVCVCVVGGVVTDWSEYCLFRFG